MAYTNIPIIVVLWEHPVYTGRRVVLTEDTPDLGVYGFNDIASSITIHRGPNYVAGYPLKAGQFTSFTLETDNARRAMSVAMG